MRPEMYKIGKFEILIASLPHRERPVAEIYYDNTFWVEISHEGDELVAQFHSQPTKECWSFPCEEALKALEEARKKLLD